MTVESNADSVPAGEAGVADPAAPEQHLTRLFVPILIGAVVAVTLGVYAKLHHPSSAAINFVVFSGPIEAKVWLATFAVLFALVQLVSALVMWGKIKIFGSPTWIGTLHRWSGRIAFLLVVPVAVNCLYALGFDTTTPRVLFHSIMGCLFFGVFTVKMLVLTKRGLAGWVLPVVGGTVFALLVLIWSTSALYFFSTKGVSF